MRDAHNLHRRLSLHFIINSCRVQLSQEFFGEDECAHVLHMRAERDDLTAEYTHGESIEPLFINRS